MRVYRSRSPLRNRNSLIGTSLDVPDAGRWPIYRNIRLSVSVVISHYRLVVRNAPLKDRDRRKTVTIKDVPDTARRPVNRAIRLTIAIEITGNRNIAGCAPLKDRDSVAFSIRIPVSIGRTINCDVGFPVAVVIGGNENIARNAKTGDGDGAVRTFQYPPVPIFRAKNADVRFAVAIKIRVAVFGTGTPATGPSAIFPSMLNVTPPQVSL